MGSSARLDSLPTELVLDILDYLPTASWVAVKLTSKHFFFNTPVPPKDWIKHATPCERRAGRRYLHERKDAETGRRKCITCNIVAPLNRFSGPLPICRWHDSWFKSTSIPLYLDPSIKDMLGHLARSIVKPVWITLLRSYCAHARDVVGWHVPECRCDCRSCGFIPVTCYVRVSPKRDDPRHCEITDDGQFMREEHWIQIAGQYLRAYWNLVPVVPLET